jgi:hypothetical protein
MIIITYLSTPPPSRFYPSGYFSLFRDFQGSEASPRRGNPSVKGPLRGIEGAYLSS